MPPWYVKALEASPRIEAHPAKGAKAVQAVDKQSRLSSFAHCCNATSKYISHTQIMNLGNPLDKSRSYGYECNRKFDNQAIFQILICKKGEDLINNGHVAERCLYLFGDLTAKSSCCARDCGLHR